MQHVGVELYLADVTKVTAVLKHFQLVFLDLLRFHAITFVTKDGQVATAQLELDFINWIK
jgi:hypothetical protein